MANTFNAQSGNYRFTFNVPCTFPDKHGNPQNGMSAFAHQLDLSQPVLDKLFGTGRDSLEVNPYEFYAGVNGWPRLSPLTTVLGPPGTGFIFNLGFDS